MIDDGIDFEYAVRTIENTYSIEWDKLEGYLEMNNYFNGKITDEGYEFMMNHPLNYYEEFDMSCIDYTDFERYFYKNSDLSGIEICLNYLNQFSDDEDVQEIISEIKSYI